jgi:hypothetical protein
MHVAMCVVKDFTSQFHVALMNAMQLLFKEVVSASQEIRLYDTLDIADANDASMRILEMAMLSSLAMNTLNRRSGAILHAAHSTC